MTAIATNDTIKYLKCIIIKFIPMNNLTYLKDPEAFTLFASDVVYYIGHNYNNVISSLRAINLYDPAPRMSINDFIDYYTHDVNKAVRSGPSVHDYVFAHLFNIIYSKLVS